MGEPNKAINLFISYSHADEQYMKELEKHLSLLKRNGYIDIWHDRRIPPGNEWEMEISEHLKASKLILFLVSADFIASEYCYGIELEQALKMHRVKTAKVIPIIIRPVLWKLSPLSKLQALPKDGTPVDSWNNKDQAYVNVTEGILTAALEMTQHDKKLDNKRELLPVSNQEKSKVEQINKNIIFAVKLEGNINEFTADKKNEILKKIKGITANSNLTLIEVEDGSIVLRFEGNKVLFDKLVALSKDRSLDALLGMSVTEVFRSISNVDINQSSIFKIETSLGLSLRQIDNSISQDCDVAKSCELSIALLLLLAELNRLTESVSEDSAVLSSMYRIVRLLDNINNKISAAGFDGFPSHSFDSGTLRHNLFSLFIEIEDLLSIFDSLDRGSHSEIVSAEKRLQLYLTHRCQISRRETDYLPKSIKHLLGIRNRIVHIQEKNIETIITPEFRDILYRLRDSFLGQVIPELEKRISSLLQAPMILRRNLARDEELPLSKIINITIPTLPHNTLNIPDIWPKDK